MREAAAHGPAHADRIMRDIVHDRRQQCAEWSRLDRFMECAVAYARADDQHAVLDNEFIEAGDLVDVDEMCRTRHAERHDRHEALPAGQNAAVLRCDFGQNRQRLIQGSRRVTNKGRWLHGITSSGVVEPDIDGRRRLDGLAGRNIVDAGLGDRPHGVEAHAARRFQRNASGDELHRFAHLIERHVVEHDDIGFRRDGFAHLFEPVAFDLDLDQTRHVRTGAFHRLGDAPGDGDVIVLDHHAAVETEAMIGAAAAGHRMLLQHAQAGRGLAGVDQLRPGALDGVHPARGLGGDAGEVLDDIERSALDGEQAARRAGHGQQRRLRRAARAVLGLDLDLDVGVVAPEAGGGNVDASQRQILPRIHVEGGLGVRLDHRQRGEVAVADVLFEPEIDQAIDGVEIQHGGTRYIGRSAADDSPPGRQGKIVCAHTKAAKTA